MLQDILLEHCYPTLSNLKFANMINVDYTDNIFEDILKLNEKLSEYNFSLIILKQTEKKLLLYLINYNLIENYNDKRLKKALESYGYPVDNFNISINFLKKRLLENEFPHEIGFFLGYPYEDVLGFINYNGKNECISGKWKVYSDVERAKNIFKKYDYAKQITKRLSLQGNNLFDIINYFKE